MCKPRNVHPTQERLKELLHYDPLTGVFTWRVKRGCRAAGSIAGITDENGYKAIGIDGKIHLSARLAWLYVHGEWPPVEIDHKNTVPGDDWIDNLRLATRVQNLANTRGRGAASGLKGAHKASKGRWTAHITIGGRMKTLGTFDTAEEAHAAYCAKAKELYGEFARFQ